MAPISLAKPTLSAGSRALSSHILRHFRHLDVNLKTASGEGRVQGPDRAGGPQVSTSMTVFRGSKKSSPVPSTETRVTTHPEVGTRALAGKLEERYQHAFARTGQHRAAVDHDVPAVRLLPAPHRSSLSPAPGRSWTTPTEQQLPNAHQGEVGLPQCGSRVGTDGKFATACAVMSSMPSSMTGDRPCPRSSTCLR